MKVVVNRGCGYFNPELIEDFMEELVKRGWIVTTFDKNRKPLDDNAYIFRNASGTLYSNFKHKNGSNAFTDKLRTDADFIEILEKNIFPELTKEFSHLEIVEIPDDVKWYIQEGSESGGCETIQEVHRVW